MQGIFKGAIKSIIRLIITFTIIVIISFIPTIYEFEYEYRRISDLNISTDNYVVALKDYFKQVSQGDLGSYSYTARGLYGDSTEFGRPISTDIFMYFKTTATTFIPALFFGITLGISAAFLTLLLKQKWRKIPNLLSFLLVAIPDFFMVLLLQFAVIWIYKETGVRIANVATGGSQVAVFLPIFTLMLFPFAYVYRTTINSFDDVLTNTYVQTAYSKGLDKFKVLLYHVAKNGVVVTLNNLPSIIMPTISNLFIIEFMYNTHGITTLVFNHHRNIDVLVVSVFLIWFMVEMILVLNEIALKFINKHKGDSYAQ